MDIGRRVYYETETGNVIFVKEQASGETVQTTIEQDFRFYSVLKERTQETVSVLELPYGAHEQDFKECNGYRVNLETLELEFSYPDPNATELQEPVYQKPLSEQVKELEERQVIMQQALDELLLGGM